MTDLQPSLFETQPAHARGPIQSQLTVDSLGRDTSLKFLIAIAVTVCSRRIVNWASDTDLRQYAWNHPVTDDMITEYLELCCNRRFQRNVIARTRGLMERDGWFTSVPDVVGRTGRPTHAVIPSPTTVDIVRTHHAKTPA